MTDGLRRNLRRFYAFRLLATSYLYGPIFMLFQAARGLSLFERFALGGIYCAVLVVVEVPTGVFADRTGRRRSMLIGALALIASSVLAACAHGFGQMAIAEILAAGSMALCSGADSAYLYDLLRAHDAGDDYARHESTASAWHLLGTALAFAGGGLLARVDLSLPYAITAIVGGLAAVVAYRLDEPPRTLAPRESAPYTLGVVRALVDVARSGRLAWLVGYSAVVFALLRATVYVYQPYLEDRGLNPSNIGFVYAGVSLVAAAVAHQTHHLRDRLGDRALLWGLLVALGASFVGLAGAARGPWMLALLLVQAVANGVYSPLTKPLLNDAIVDSSRRAAVLSVESMARRAAMAILVPLVGLSGGTAGSSDEMLLCGAVGLAGLIALLTASGYRTRVPHRSCERSPAK